MIPRTPQPLLATLLLVLALAGPAAGAPARDATVPEGSWPLAPEPEVVRGFDPPADPWGAGHRGVDLAGHPGQVVRAALAGRISFAGPLAGRGVVVVDHGDTRTTYEPVSATVEVGASVARGSPVGALTVPLSHCFPAACLHWGWRRGDTYLDPLLLVGGAADVRLLPLWRDAPVPVPRLPLVRPPLPRPGQAPVAPPLPPYAAWWRLAGWLQVAA